MAAAPEPRYDLAQLTDLATGLFVAAGLAEDLAAPVGKYLVMADAMGHSTHGLALASWYIDHVQEGTVACAGGPEVLSDAAAAVCWNGRRLPGAYLAEKAMRLAVDRARDHGACTVAVGNAHHIGALAVYLETATEACMLASIASSSPSGAQVAPYGGLTGLFNPQPVAYGIPTGGDPILIDISAAATTANMAKRLSEEGRSYEVDCLMDADGALSRDPGVLGRGGTILPVGGLAHGQKGYGLSLSIEALTQGLAGYGRADAPKGTNSAFTVQVHDPRAFGGLQAFTRQTAWLRDACHASKPHPDFGRVRLPGEAALARRAEAVARGVRLYPGIMAGLERRAQEFGLTPPQPLEEANA